jgi:hypothetical protein
MTRRSLELAFFARFSSLRISLSCSQQISPSVFFHCASDNIIFPGQLLFPMESRVPCTTAQPEHTSKPLLPVIEFA